MHSGNRGGERRIKGERGKRIYGKADTRGLADNSTQDGRSRRGRHILVLKRTYSTASLGEVPAFYNIIVLL
jgi:hypothetical protein